MPALWPFASARPTGGRSRRGAAARRSGRRGELFCAFWLLAKGYRLLGFRLKTPFAEIDILAQRRGVIVVVEIKRRASLAEALDAVGFTQRDRLRRAARFLLGRRRPGHRADAAAVSIRLDLIALAPGRWPRHIHAAWGED